MKNVYGLNPTVFKTIHSLGTPSMKPLNTDLQNLYSGNINYSVALIVPLPHSIGGDHFASLRTPEIEIPENSFRHVYIFRVLGYYYHRESLRMDSWVVV